mgnify:CR=1 FL=1
MLRPGWVLDGTRTQMKKNGRSSDVRIFRKVETYIYLKFCENAVADSRDNPVQILSVRLRDRA